MAAIETWSQVSDDNDQAPPDGSPERHDRDEVNNIQRETMGALRTFFEDAEWLDLTLENDSSFTVSRAGVDRFLVTDDSGTDARSKFPVGRWVKVTGTGGNTTIAYGEVSATPLYGGGNTTVILKNIVDADYVTEDIPDTTVTKVQCYWNSRARQAAFHPVGTLVGEAPAELLAVDDISDAAVITQLNTATGLDADLLGGVAAAGYQLAGSSVSPVVNGGMDIWQRGLSFTTPATETWTADQWYVMVENAFWDIARDTTSAPTGFKHSMKITANGTTTDKVALLVVFPAEDCEAIIGDGAASLSFWVNAETTMQIRVGLLEWRSPGVEDAPDVATMINAWGAEATDPTFNDANWSYANAPVDDVHAGTGAWVKVTVENITVDPLTENLAVIIWQDDETFNNTESWNFTGLRLEPGAVAQEFVPALFGEELTRCQRNFWTTYDHGVAPGTVTDIGMIEHANSRNVIIGTGDAILPVRFPVPMFKIPTVLVYAPASGNSGNVSNPGDKAASAIAASTGTKGANIQVTGVPALGAIEAHCTAEAFVSA